MKPFDIEKARNGHPVCTRDGRDVEILKFDLKGHSGEIAGIIKELDGSETLTTWFDSGEFVLGEKDNEDLFLKSEQKEGWVNVYEGPRVMGRIHETKVQAEGASKAHNDYLDTVPIKWQE